MTHRFGHRNRRHFPDLPVAEVGDEENLVDVVNRVREALLILLGDKQPVDRAVNYGDLSALGLLDPNNYAPRPQPYKGLSHGRISGVIDTTIATGVWTSLAFGTIDIINDRLFKTDGSGLELRVTGEYLLSFRLPVTAYSSPTDTNYTTRLRMLINGGGATGLHRQLTNEENAVILTPTVIETFDADDVITFEFTHDNANTMTINQPVTLNVVQLNPDPVQPWALGIPQR